jgi:hypothetical protein
MFDGASELDTRELERKLRDIAAALARIEGKVDALRVRVKVFPPVTGLPKGALEAMQGGLGRGGNDEP